MTASASGGFHRGSVSERGQSAAFFVKAHNPKHGKTFVIQITLKMHLHVELNVIGSIGKHNVQKLSVKLAFVRRHLKDIAAVSTKQFANACLGGNTLDVLQEISCWDGFYFDQIRNRAVEHGPDNTLDLGRGFPHQKTSPQAFGPLVATTASRALRIRLAWDIDQ
jgi:hypothetical protein